MSIIEMYLLMLIFSAFMYYLYKDSKRFAYTENVVLLEETENRRSYVSYKPTGHKKEKVLLVLYSIICRKCNSNDVLVELCEDDDCIHIVCKKCKYVTRIKLADIAINEIDDDEKTQDS